ncbi:MAG: helix-turn-helix domain-containing protein [Fibrobacterota bacterium]|nr:helix-turn-helix domain-containing protein [Chitinispirillaceae bacterium]
MTVFERLNAYLTNIFLLLPVVLVCSFSQPTTAQHCVQFVKPIPGKTVTSPLCTLLLESTCNNISKIELQARYFSSESDSGIIISLGSKRNAPYEFIWDISEIPNQLFTGVAFLAEVSKRNGDIETTQRDGVFFAHHQVNNEKRTIFYEHSGTKRLTTDTFKIVANRSNLKIKSSIYWNEKELAFYIDVEDPFFNSTMSEKVLSEIGVDILIDPTLGRKPYPTKDIIAFTIPLTGIPNRVTYQPAFDEGGAFKMISKQTNCDFQYSIDKDDYKGYKIYFPIPGKVFRDSIPDSMSCNIILRAMNEQNLIGTFTWANSSRYDARSPMVFNSLYKAPKPISKNLYLIGIIAFIAGLSITLLVAFIIRQIQRPKLKTAIEKTEAEQKLFDNLKDAVDRQITYKNLTADIVARELHISVKKLSNLVKNLTGLSFQHFLMYLRIEIAKERLRSSFCKENEIADKCGFSDEKELERYFMKFERTTPEKYRQKQQVT